MTVTTEHFYTGDGSTTSFAYTFPYYQTSDIKVTVADVLKTESTHYNITGTNVVFTGGNTPANATTVHIYRETDVDTSKATFAPGSSIRATDLNNNETQLLYCAQEEQGQKLISSNIATGAITTTHIKDGTIVDGDIANSTITYNKIQNISSDVVLGRDSAGAGVVEEISPANLRTLINVEDGSTGDQTATEIKTSYESNSNTNAYIDTHNALVGGITASASEINKIDGYTGSTTNLNIVDGMSKATALTTNSDTEYPTSKAVADFVSNTISPLGGFEVIADEVSFPNTIPASGVVISIGDAGGVVVNGSGVSTSATTVGSSAVTINGFPSSLYGETLVAGVGLMVSSTGSSNTYNYHKILGKEGDIKQLSDDINDFHSRYRVASSAPTSNNDSGDMYYNTGNDTLFTYNANSGSWEEVQSIGNFFISTLSPAFDGSTQNFTLTNAPSYSQQVLLSINGVVQKPNSGTSTPSEGFALDGSTIKLASAPASGSDYFAVVIGSTVNIGAPSLNTVTSSMIVDGAIMNVDINTNANIAGSKLADDSIAEVKLDISNAPVDGRYLQYKDSTDQLTWATVAQYATPLTTEGDILYRDGSGDQRLAKGTAGQVLKMNSGATAPEWGTDNNTVYTHPNHSGEVTSSGDGATTIASDVVDEDNLKISNAGSDGQYLQKQSGNTGGLTWATVSSYTHPNHTGDVTSIGDGATTIANDAVTTVKIADDQVTADKLADTAVTAGTYTTADITVDAQGRITAAASGTVSNVEIANDAVTTAKIIDDAVTYEKIQDVSATDRVLGRDSSGAGVVEEITPSNLRTMINVEDGATADQTNAEIRAAVEAASDSNVFTDADHTKLNAIEASATADQTGAEIKTAYEAESDTNAYTDAEKTKLSGIATGAEVNVQADWNSSSGDSLILNKPTIPAAQVQSDWNATSGLGEILNKPTIPSAYTHPNHTGDVTSSGDGATTITNDAVVTAKILDSNVTTAKIADDAITTAKIADAGTAGSGITTAKIADANITTAKIADSSITAAKLNTSGVAATGSYLKEDFTWGIPGGTITALNNATANRLTTIGSTTTELDGEANLTFDGTTLAVGGADGALTVTTSATMTGRTISQGYECPAAISADWSIGSNNNAFFPGPMTVNSGVTVTVPSGSTLTVV